MKFNAKKCFVMNMTNKRKKLSFQYTLHAQILDPVQHHQYLGVFLTHKYKWDFQYAHITKKASRVLGMLRRNLRGCSRTIKSTAYLALVRPHLEYAASVYDPYEAKYIKQLEMVQRRAARFVNNNYNQRASVTDMLRDLNWDSLEHRREVARLALMKQIQSGQSAIPKTLTPLAVTRSRRSSTSNSQHLKQTYCRTDFFKFSYFPRTCKDWNKLPDSVINTGSIDSFRSHALQFLKDCSIP